MIVVGGEALIDLVPAPETGGLLQPRPGGGPFNTAVALGRLGVPVAFLSRISTDAFGVTLCERLRRAGVDTALVQRGPQPTTLAVVGRTANGSTGYTFYADGTADRLVADPGPLPAEVTILSLGTLSLVLEPGASVYEALLHRESAAGRLTVLDPNIRPGLIADADAYRTRYRSWLPDIRLLKVSMDDAEWLANNDNGNVAETVRNWLTAGVDIVVLTRGTAGLTACTAAGERVDVPAVPARVVDTIGAGDTVHAAVLAWLHTHGITNAAGLAGVARDGWVDALEFAARAAAVTVGRAGAEPPLAEEIS